MDFLQIANTRYTTKQYDPSKRLNAEQIERLEDILRMSPSSIDSQPWQFHFIGDGELKTALAKASHFNEPKVIDCSHIVVFTAIDSVDLFQEQAQANLSEHALSYFTQNLKPLGEDAVKAWMQKQVYISLGYFLAACAAEGVDSTPMEVIDTAEYDRILGLKGYHTLFAVAIGARDPEDANQPSLRPKSRLPKNSVIKTY